MQQPDARATDFAEALHQRFINRQRKYNDARRKDAQEQTLRSLWEMFALQSEEVRFRNDAGTTSDSGHWIGECVIAGRTFTISAEGDGVVLGCASTAAISNINGLVLALTSDWPDDH
jgi:hypothetical protein